MEKICKNCKWWEKEQYLRNNPKVLWGQCNKPDMDDIAIIAVPVETFGCNEFKEKE